MAHMPIRALVAEARGFATECAIRSRKLMLRDKAQADTWEAMAGRLANHADHVEALLNDYPEG